MIERVVKTFTDPETGQILGTRKQELGVLELTGVEEKFAYGNFSAFEGQPPERGDLVTIMRQ